MLTHQVGRGGSQETEKKGNKLGERLKRQEIGPEIIKTWKWPEKNGTDGNGGRTETN